MKQLFIALLLLIPAMTFAGCSEDHDLRKRKHPTIREMMMTIRERLSPEPGRF